MLPSSPTSICVVRCSCNTSFAVFSQFICSMMDARTSLPEGVRYSGTGDVKVRGLNINQSLYYLLGDANTDQVRSFAPFLL